MASAGGGVEIGAHNQFGIYYYRAVLREAP
jgi:hypothetical protein